MSLVLRSLHTMVRSSPMRAANSDCFTRLCLQSWPEERNGYILIVTLSVPPPALKFQSRSVNAEA